MIRRIFSALDRWLAEGLLSLSARIPPNGRIIITIAMVLLLSAGSVATGISLIYNMGKRKGGQIRIEHIEYPELPQNRQTDSVNHKNILEYE